MKTLLTTTALLLAASVSQADIIKCSFTEPFINTVYSTTQSTLTISGFDIQKQVIKNVSFQIKGPGSFDLIDNKGKVLQKLTLNFAGSDGMSDNVYPYEVQDFSMHSYANGGYGGCSSNFLKTKNSDNN